MEYLIIGASAAGLSAARALRRVDPKGHVTILCREMRPYSRVMLPYLLADTINQETAFLSVPHEVQLLSNYEVVSIDPQNKQVMTASNKILYFDKLLIATGASAIKPQIIGINYPFVFTVRDMSDVRGIQSQVKKGGQAVVIGAGPVGMRTGEALHKLGMKVTFIEVASSILPRILDPPAAIIVERLLRQEGIEVIKNERVVQIIKGKVILESGERRKCDLVIIAVGIQPNIDFLKGSGIEFHHGIIVDKYQRTNITDIYAAGDVAEAFDIAYGTYMVNALWSVAMEQGYIAGLNMASCTTSYTGSIARNTLRILGLSVFTAGMSAEDGEEAFRKQGAGFYRKLIFKEGILKGAILIGKLRGAGIYPFMIYHKQKYACFIKQLIQGNFNFPFLLYYYRWIKPLGDKNIFLKKDDFLLK